MTSQPSSALWILLLVWNFGDLFGTHKTTETAEFVCIQHFCEYVSNIIMGIDVGKWNFIWLDLFMEEMVFNVYVFDMIM